MKKCINNKIIISIICIVLVIAISVVGLCSKQDVSAMITNIVSVEQLANFLSEKSNTKKSNRDKYGYELCDGVMIRDDITIPISDAQLTHRINGVSEYVIYGYIKDGYSINIEGRSTKYRAVSTDDPLGYNRSFEIVIGKVRLNNILPYMVWVTNMRGSLVYQSYHYAEFVRDIRSYYHVVDGVKSLTNVNTALKQYFLSKDKTGAYLAFSFRAMDGYNVKVNGEYVKFYNNEYEYDPRYNRKGNITVPVKVRNGKISVEICIYNPKGVLIWSDVRTEEVFVKDREGTRFCEGVISMTDLWMPDPITDMYYKDGIIYIIANLYAKEGYRVEVYADGISDFSSHLPDKYRLDESYNQCTAKIIKIPYKALFLNIQVKVYKEQKLSNDEVREKLIKDETFTVDVMYAYFYEN